MFAGYWNPTVEFIRQLKILADGGDVNAAAELDALERETKRPTPMTIMDARVATAASTVEFFRSSDLVDEGLRNLAAAKVDQNVYFMPYAIQILGAYDDTNVYDADRMKRTSFKPIHTLNTSGLGLENGSVTIRFQESAFVNKLPLVGLHRQDNTIIPAGAMLLPSTEIIKPSQTIQVNYKSPEGYNVPSNVALQFILLGVGTSPKSNS